MAQKIFALLLAAAMFLSLCACGTQAQGEDEIQGTAPAVEEVTEPTATPEPTEEPLSETALKEQEIIARLDYGAYNFITEAEFYAALSEILALHDLKMTRYPGENAYYYFAYNNLEGVKLLTISKTMEEIEADRAEAQIAYEEQVAEFNAEKEALASGEEYVPEETEDDTETETEKEEIVFDAAKDVENSQDYVVSFVLSAGDSETDQQVMFLVSAAVWCIMNPNYDNTDEAFLFLWRALYNTYNTSGGTTASTIDGIDNSYSFSIPGNATEAWLGTDDSGENYILAVTMYAVYDEIIDIAGSTGTGFDSAVTDWSSMYG